MHSIDQNEQKPSSDSSNTLDTFSIVTSDLMPCADINLDNLKIDSITVWHELAVICLASYLVLQNAFGISDVVHNYFEPVCGDRCVKPISYILYVLLLPCTVAAVMLSKALKIIEIPRRISSWGQETLLQEVEKELIKKNKNKSKFGELIIAIANEEFNKEIKPESDTKYGFDYTLCILAKRYNTTLALLIIDQENNLHHAVSTYLRQRNNPKAETSALGVAVLPYSKIDSLVSTLTTNNSSASIASNETINPVSGVNQRDLENNNLSEQSYTLITPSFGTRRLWSAYAPPVPATTIVGEIIFHLSSTLYLGIIPIVVSILQGSGTLANAFSVTEDSPWSTQVGITVAGAVIGFIRGWVTYKQKADDASERFHAWCLQIIGLFKSIKHFYEQVESLLALIYSTLPSSTTEAWTKTKQLLCIGFGCFAALGTVVFYGGLGFFFSNSGLINLVRLMGLPGMSTTALFAISSQFCLGQVALNAIGNQGPEIIYRYYQRACGTPQEARTTERTCAQRCLSLAVKGDAVSTGLSADSGALALLQLLWPVLAYGPKVGLSAAICLALVFSQNTFAWTSGQKDAHLWGGLWDKRYKPAINKIYCFFPKKTTDEQQGLNSPVEDVDHQPNALPLRALSQGSTHASESTLHQGLITAKPQKKTYSK